MRIAYITAGAAGMYCGSCLHDNTLVSALLAQNHDALLIPTYTPITTDEPNVSQKRVFFGGINVYLQQKLALFRHTPWSFDRLFDSPLLLRWASKIAARTEAKQLGDMTLSMLQGSQGRQRKEIEKLVRWLSADVRPEIINLTNALLSGMVPELKRRLKVPVLCTLQGDDVFLEGLPAKYRDESLRLIRGHCRDIDGFIATSIYYAHFMVDYFQIPRDKIHVVYPGLNLVGHGQGQGSPAREAFTIGYLARICPEKGLHLLAEAFHFLHQQGNSRPMRLRVSGWLGGTQQSYFEEIRQRMHERGLADRFEHFESPDHASKVGFLQSLDVLSVPTTYREPKGLYVLEALANGVPVVQPRHGSFPELIEATGGGLLVNPMDPVDLAAGLRKLMDDRAHREELGQRGKKAVHEHFHAARMARETAELYKKYL
jgi:glycosyltransferase involved in cell wall biosynthesis